MADYALANLAGCVRCPRLVAWRERLRASDSEICSQPIGSWGVARPALLVVGLAPGANGAARSGKAFVGDDSGQFLFSSLYRCGFATSADPQSAHLLKARLTNVVKCLPPANAPNALERNNCAGYLSMELARYCPPTSRKPRVVVCLGGVAYGQVCRTLGVRAQPFVHGSELRLGRQVTLLASFHPSRLNVNTGRLSRQMLDAIFQRCRQLLA